MAEAEWEKELHEARHRSLNGIHIDLCSTQPLSRQVSEETLEMIRLCEEQDAMECSSPLHSSSCVSEETLERIRILEEQGPMECTEVPQELQETGKYRLAVVAKAMCRILIGQDGVMMLLMSCPFQLEEQEHTILQEMLSKWLVNFERIVESIPSDAPDETAMKLMTAAMRGILQLVTIWNRDKNHDELVGQSIMWIQSLLMNLTGSHMSVEGMDNARVSQLFSAASSGQSTVQEHEDIPQALARFGCRDEFIAGINGEVASVLLKKLREWQQTEAEEIFTCRRLVVDGRLSAGLGLVVRRGNESNTAHIFVYDLASLYQWVGRSHQDPSTRQPLDVGEILEVS
jgi:hypothetical protein